MFYLIKDAQSVCHTLSEPSKMPCYSYSIPASRCIIGMKMRNVVGSVCASCYACKGFYVFKNAKNALEKRFQSLKDEKWIDSIVFLIQKKEKSGFFRWHDSGDLQGVWHLANIVEVAKRLPNIKFWLPTREYKIVTDYLKVGKIPENLIVRLSALMIDGKAPESLAKRHNLHTSGVSSSEGHTCLAPEQDNKCGDCRACWSKEVFNINYKKH